MKNILLFDDDPDRTESWSDTLRKLPYVTNNFRPESMKITEFNNTIDELMRRQSHFHQGLDYEPKDIDLDKADIFIIDFNLLDVDRGIKITGETAAYLSRCFSQCKIIIGINQFMGASANGDNPFDMKLSGYPKSYYDLNIGSKQFENKGLWDADFDGFRPWYWPLLPKMLDDFDKKLDEVKEHVNEPISEILNFGEESKYFPDSVNNFIGNNPAETSFKEFVLESENGVYAKDRDAPLETIARMAISKITQWLEFIILQRQDILIDAPHLVERYPSLLIGDREEIETWNGVVQFQRHDKMNLDHEKIDDFRFLKYYWLSRPVWFWELISENEAIAEVKNPWEKETIPYHFCEDSSRFLIQEECREFTVDFNTPYVRRYIRKDLYADVEYRPRVKLVESPG